jgi:sterol desaturase/sphingolipid hydroxylase (fatty acid hydroxylase superfamily)
MRDAPRKNENSAAAESAQHDLKSASTGAYRVSTFSALAVFAVASGLVIAAVLFASYRASQRGEGPSLSDILRPLRLARQIGETVLIVLRSPAPVLVIALVLERLLPVTPGQRDLTRGFGQDLFWYLVDFARNVSWVPFYLALLIWIKVRLLGSFELIPPGVLPSVMAWTIAILAWDLLSYLSHVLRHRIDFLWRFHAIHHSQREMNFFTQHRFHDLDVIVDLTIRTIPLLVLNANLPTLTFFYALSLAHFQLYHSSIRTNYGPLRFVLVNPQFHRVHHARDPMMHNRNYGIAFSFWDRAFGTRHLASDEYPELLGIEDDNFPIEQGTRLRDVLSVFAAQILYPFLQTGKASSRQ